MFTTNPIMSDTFEAEAFKLKCPGVTCANELCDGSDKPINSLLTRLNDGERGRYIDRAASAYDAYSSSAAIWNSEDEGIWAPVEELHNSTYGADPCHSHMITTNWAAAVEMFEDAEVEWTTDRGQLIVQLVDVNGRLTGASSVIEQIEDALENYPLLDEDAYSQACSEEADEFYSEALDDALKGELTEEVEAYVDANATDVEEIVSVGIMDGDIEVNEEDCYYQFCGAWEYVNAEIEKLIAAEVRAAFEATICDKTIDMF